MTKILAAVVLSWIALCLLLEATRFARQSGHRNHYWQIVRSIRWWMLPAAFAQAVLVIAVWRGIAKLIPALSWSWWRLLGGTANPVLGQTTQAGLIWRIVGIVFPVAAAFLIPLFAYGEELMFRYQAENWSSARRIRKQFLFGLWHISVGIPIAVCFALTISGLYFLGVYLLAMRRLGPAIGAVENLPKVDTLPYPPCPAATAYDPEERKAINREWDRVHTENQRRFDQRAEELPRLSSERAQRIREIKLQAVYQSAAAHAVSNWTLLTTAAVMLIVL